MPFGQLVVRVINLTNQVGPPGCGKTTYCYGLSQFYAATERPCAIINLDPANDGIPYKADIDISELITLQDVMEEYNLGPNGGLVYCMEYLEVNIDWLLEKLKPLQGFFAAYKDKYLVFDCPGQVELFTNHNALKNIILKLQSLDHRLCVVHLVDAHYCIDPSKYVSMLMVSLKTMLHLECPHINILSKIDLMESYGTLVQDLSYLLERLDQDPFTKRYKKLSSALCELVEDFGLVGFLTLCIQDKESVLHAVRAIDKANGYIFGGLEQSNESIFATADRWDAWDRYTQEVAEKYLSKDADAEMEQSAMKDYEDVIGGSLLGEISERETPI